MSGLKHRGTAEIVPFPAPGQRACRPAASEPPRGVILLFTGVRYERPSDPAPLPVEPPAGDIRKRG